MTGIPTWHPIGLIGVCFALLSLLLGVGVALLAVQGYVENDARPMLFVAVGFVLVVVVPLVALVGMMLSTEQIIIWTVSAAVQAVGLCLILYGLWKPTRTEVI
ncbi:DUF7521 family protein [Halovenus carboxidivorans]